MGELSAWDRYWQSDRIASCMDGAGRSNYDHRIASGWRHFFSTAPDGSRILDLCTGNGAVAVLAAECGAGDDKRFEIVGIDLAEIDPCRYVTRYGSVAAGIRFLGRTSCEKLDFPDGSFDRVVSQYGIEYSDIARSLQEGARVCAPGGRMRFSIHAREGTVVAETKRALEDADFLVKELDLCGRAERCFEAVTAVEKSDRPTAGEKRSADRYFAEFCEALQRSGERAERAEDSAMLRNSAGVLLNCFEYRDRFPLSTLLDKVSEVRDEIDAHRYRQQALVEASRSAEEIGSLCGLLNGLGMTDVSWNAQRLGPDFVAYVMRASRPAGANDHRTT